MFGRNLTITELVSSQLYGQTRKTSGARIHRQNRTAKREAATGAQPWFLTEAERDDLVAQLQGLRGPAKADAAYLVNVAPCVRMLAEAVPSYRRPGHLVVLLSHRHAVLMGNVLRRLDGPVPGLERVDEIACRRAS
ncbi:hypothetical protein [Methylobacterium gnaphalii]|uniref:Uncharacterized protein n=1 Tax=Methylobacterium gnaphalii TaxID=1010610 RepID=A0A512JP07_9HYPH|nr:hypothetical protein [Methylobacterium gnaphalii]GEP11691.1 hypothetical protein MGN01_35360 [Methylobacterium gnaphalii]GJD68794.1 hypothetical protein MMMDOFMJ_1718 [Methylobacterium gnaphalii]GLS50189.1 hypothetical protein GCM10007885_30410 [Methylobacterium gnaphalii]